MRRSAVVGSGDLRALREIAADVTSRECPPATVVEVGWVSGLATIRLLGRAGVPVVALDHHTWALGFRSRYARHVLVADPLTERERFVESLVQLGDLLGQPGPIFAGHDEQLNAIASNRDRLGGRFLYPFPPWELLERVQRKRFQLEQAEAVGVPIPATAYPTSATDAVAAGSAMGYPVLVKPSAPEGFKRRFRRQAFRCSSASELERTFADAEPFGPMVQEFIPGADSELYTFGSYIAEDGTALGLFCGRKLRQTPPGVGTCRLGEAVWVDDVVVQGLRLLQKIGLHGISQVEFKRDDRDGRFKLMEVNPRLWKWHGLAAACGVNLPLIAYRDLLGERPEPVRMLGEGKRWGIVLQHRERPLLPRPPYVDAIFALDDLGPAAYQTARYVWRLVR
jgi:predicted ATP-grasp superfamily ATP-dependent carboligase